MTAYLQFRVGQQHYAIPVAHVIEVLHLVDITPIPDQPQDHLGVITLRGQMMPVIDLSYRFQRSHANLTMNTPLIAIQVKEDNRVLVVDEVDDVIDFANVVMDYPEPNVDAVVRRNDTMIIFPSISSLAQ